MSTVLVIGSGGRECAAARTLASSPLVARVWVTPGNAGTRGDGGGDGGADAGDKVRNVDAPGLKQDVDGWVAAARLTKADLVFVGPEAPLVEGVADALAGAGFKCFGPTRAAAKLEASKAFSKAFFDRYALPTARYKVFTEFEAAAKHVREIDYPVVIKASGLCAGKGVLIPEPGDVDGYVAALEQIMKSRAFGEAGDEVVVEELLPVSYTHLTLPTIA